MLNLFQNDSESGMIPFPEYFIRNLYVHRFRLSSRIVVFSEPLFGASIVTAGGITFDCNLFPPESGGNANLFYDGEYMYQPLLLFDGQ